MRRIVIAAICLLLVCAIYSQDAPIKAEHVKCSEQLTGLEFTVVQRDSMLEGLNDFLETYQIQARTEGKSEHTIRIYTTAITTLLRFLERKGYSTDVNQIGYEELREFSGYLQKVPAFMDHPYTGPQKKKLISVAESAKNLDWEAQAAATPISPGK